MFLLLDAVSTPLPLPTTLNEAALIMFSVACIGVILRGHKRDTDALDELRKKRDTERDDQLLGIRSSTDAMKEMGTSVRGVTEGLGLLAQKVGALDATITTLQRSVDELHRKAAT